MKQPYSKILRAIGQDLDGRGLKTFNLEENGDVYVLACGYQEPPCETPVSLRYTPADIEELDRSGREKRAGAAKATDFVTLTQVLRAVGGYLDKNGCRLIAVSNNHLPSAEVVLRVEYINADRERIIDDRTGSAIYDMCVSMYKQRGKGRRGSEGAGYWRQRPGT